MCVGGCARAVSAGRGESVAWTGRGVEPVGGCVGAASAGRRGVVPAGGGGKNDSLKGVARGAGAGRRGGGAAARCEASVDSMRERRGGRGIRSEVQNVEKRRMAASEVMEKG